MKAILSVENYVSSFVTMWWTPLFMVIFFAIVAYALWPKNKMAFDDAARMPLRED
ncbi:cbb3-type cytochrome c oxidase subunit 3 [Rhodopseudomonas pseudopalustris]|uniref:Cbb3-type cytochrome oxidase component n=2 Tax=Rhodopseudomonas TaxID=1073 RepID=Q13D69_RHOPS|nr:cbb3-type cytochrome c oxidase subunit 3 [Rhodopseudomonas pseudopalustris]ABE37970.1 Cbb3-type cytochrome oxidase component [Rhodopseudomonas palustris BisB5]MBB1091186.1 cbb3-type cytochrome c oxidase subunit 3 [Rhodopseudomonas palustris]SEO97651.1 cytochrome c oxidase cbb3-type subunit 4 [Rhodopseudomonas pseudopalustris]